jgi:hypothetical protein
MFKLPSQVGVSFALVDYYNRISRSLSRWEHTQCLNMPPCVLRDFAYPISLDVHLLLITKQSIICIYTYVIPPRGLFSLPLLNRKSLNNVVETWGD